MTCKSSDGKFTVLDAQAYSKTLLGGCLIECVDKVRDINTQLGARPYRVRMVRTRWSGGERGNGVEEVIDALDILPTPKVRSLEQLIMMMQSSGRDEIGDVFVTEISARYTEDCLLGLGPNGEDVPDDQHFYWEIVLFMQDGTEIMRRFSVRGTPELDAANVQWKVRLLRASDDRNRVTSDPEG